MKKPDLYKGFRYPGEVISHVVWLYFQFSLSFRDIEECCFAKLLKGLWYVPRVLVANKLKRYAAAKAKILPGVGHRQHKRLNNRAEVSHQPTRQRGRQMRRYKSPRHAQRFLSAHAQINNAFRCPLQTPVGSTVSLRPTSGVPALK